MLGYYKYTRNQIVNIIKKSPKTKDGYYYVYKFPVLNSMRGKIDGERDTKYYYTREYFKNKICFNEDDINCYLTISKMDYDINKMKTIDDKLKDIIGELNGMKLDNKIEDKDYTLDELIDTSIYLLNNKY